MLITAFFTGVLAMSSIVFAIRADNRSGDEFDLRMRPYIIIDNIKSEHTEIDNDKGKTRYGISIKNIGITPAKITHLGYFLERKDSLLDSIEHDKSNLEGQVIGKDQIFWVYTTVEMLKNKSANIKFIIKYIAVLDGLDNEEHETEVIFTHKYQEELKYSSGDMN